MKICNIFLSITLHIYQLNGKLDGYGWEKLIKYIGTHFNSGSWKSFLDKFHPLQCATVSIPCITGEQTLLF
jgi:hypothetical protein